MKILRAFFAFLAVATLSDATLADTAYAHDKQAGPEAAQDDGVSVEPGGTQTLADGTKLLGGKQFTVHVAGEGRDVILIPGLASPRAVWNATKAQLAGHYRLHIIQIRGFGDAPGANAQGPVIDKFVAELADYIDDEIMDKDIKDKDGGKKPLVIGHSLGGFSAMKLAADHPQLIERAMVIDSLPFFGMIFGPAMTAETLEPQATIMRDIIAAQKSYTADARTLQTMSISEEGRAQVAAWAQDADPKAVASFLYDLMVSDIRPQMRAITVPITMLYPLDESVMPAARVDAMYTAAFAGADSVTLKRIENSRHFIMLDQPEAFAAAVEEFLIDKPAK